MTSQERAEYKAVIKRSGGKSEISGKQPICIHHIVFRSHGGINDRRNMIALTPQEHTMVHSDEPYWREYLLNRQRGIYGMIDINDLKKHGKYANLKYGN